MIYLSCDTDLSDVRLNKIINLGFAATLKPTSPFLEGLFLIRRVEVAQPHYWLDLGFRPLPERGKYSSRLGLTQPIWNWSGTLSRGRSVKLATYFSSGAYPAYLKFVWDPFKGSEREACYLFPYSAVFMGNQSTVWIGWLQNCYWTCRRSDSWFEVQRDLFFHYSLIELQVGVYSVAVVLQEDTTLKNIHITQSNITPHKISITKKFEAIPVTDQGCL
jgi:hypothetical protein